METKTDAERYLRTTSLPLAAFLFVKGGQVAGINETSSLTKKELAFTLTDRLAELAHKYKFGDRNDPDLLVPAHLYEQARNELLDRLHGE